MPADRVHVVPNFLAASSAPESDLAGERAPIAFFAGRLEEAKGIRELIAAFGQVRPPARLLIAGDGPLRPLVMAAAERGPRIQYLGRISAAEVAGHLRRAAVLVLPSLWRRTAR